MLFVDHKLNILWCLKDVFADPSLLLVVIYYTDSMMNLAVNNITNILVHDFILLSIGVYRNYKGDISINESHSLLSYWEQYNIIYEES